MAERPDPDVLQLVANGKTLSNAPNRLSRLTPTDPGIGMAAIRRLYEENGYVWLKGFLRRSDVIDFRGWVFGHLQDTGLLKPNTEPSLGIAAATGIDKAQADRRLMSIVRSTAFEGFCAQPRLSRFMDTFLSGISYLHKRKIIRFTQPQTAAATPAHYDLSICAAAPAALSPPGSRSATFRSKWAASSISKGRTGSASRWRRSSSDRAPNSARKSASAPSTAT